MLLECMPGYEGMAKTPISCISDLCKISRYLTNTESEYGSGIFSPLKKVAFRRDGEWVFLDFSDLPLYLDSPLEQAVDVIDARSALVNKAFSEKILFTITEITTLEGVVTYIIKKGYESCKEVKIELSLDLFVTGARFQNPDFHLTTPYLGVCVMQWKHREFEIDFRALGEFRSLESIKVLQARVNKVLNTIASFKDTSRTYTIYKEDT